MAISFDEWRTAKQQGKQATDKPDFAAWRLKKQQEEEDAKKLSVTGTASGSVGIPESVGAPLPSVKNRFATPDTIKLGDTHVPATGVSRAIAYVATGIGNLGESVPASYREGARTSKASVAKQELDFTGRVTLEPARPAKYERGGILVSPATPGKFLTGKEAEDYVASLEAPTEDTRTMEEYRQEAGIFGRAATSTLSQPEQALSVLGGVAGAAVGMPGVGAALGSAPAIISAYNAEYLRNRQLGLGPEESRANALAKLPVEALTEFVGGRFGAKSLPAGVVLGGAEEGAAELGGMGVDLASQQLSAQPEAYEQKLPKTFAEGLTQVTESALGGMMGAGIMAGAPRALGAGVSAAREMLAKAGGISDGRPDAKDTRSSMKIDPKINEGLDLAQPKADTSYVDAPINIAPSNIDTVEAPVTTGINIEETKRDSVNPDGDSKKREIPAKEDTLSTAPLSSVQLTPADAGTIIDTRLSSLREASQRNRLDEGTVKALQREDEELRLTLQEDEKRKAAGILQTPERPYLSDNARNLISQKRAEVRERLEQHRAAVGYGNELRDLETRLSKLGESDSDFVALADSLVRGQGASVSRAQQQMAPVASQNQSQTLPATPVAPTAVEASVASQEAATSVPDAAPTVPVSNVVQSPVTSAQVPSVSNTPKAPKAKKTRAPKTISEGDALAQAFTELQQKSVSDPAFQKQVTDNPSLMRQMATKRAAEIVAASKAPKAPTAPVVEETPTLDMATPASNKPRYESKDAFLTELYSGVGDKEATEARKIADNIVVYDGDADLAGIDPEVAIKVQEAVQKQGATGARPKAFQYKGKVYFNMEGVQPGEAKSTFLHEARVHLAAKAEPARVSALASRVVALAKAGDATAQAAAKTVAKEYPGVTPSAKEGNESAKDLSREELLADFAQRVYDRVKSGQGVSGTIKRLYSDVMSYLRDLYTTAAKKLFGERFALNITDVDILDAVRYGRTAAGFKGEAKPTALAPAAQKAKDDTPAMMFVGEQAAGDNRALDEAKRLDEDGWDQQAIRMRTGWFRSPWDNKWRREIDDSGAGFKQDFASLEESKVFGTPKKYRLADVLNHPALFAEYPELADVSFTKRAGFMDIFRSIQGSYDADSNEISLTPYVQDPISTLLHEVQHWIQNKETFATGGNQSSAVAALPQKQKELLAKELIADLEKQYSDTLDTYDSLTKLRDSEEVLQKLAAYADAADVADAKIRAEGRGWFDDNTENNRRKAARKELEDALKGADITADIHELYAKIASKVEKGVGRYSATFAAVNESIADTEKKAAELTTRLGGLASGNPEVLNKELQKHSRAYEFYQSLAGEIEARAVQERMRYPIEERVSKDPYEATLSRDRIRKEDAIVAYDGGRAGQESRNNSQPDTGGVELPEGSKVSRGVNKLLDKGTALLRPRGTASREAQLMGERAVGTSNELRIAGEVLVKELVSELNTVLAGETARKQAMYRYDIGQYLAGKKELGANIPKNIRDTVDAMRLMLDNNTMRLIALGAVESKDIPRCSTIWDGGFTEISTCSTTSRVTSYLRAVTSRWCRRWQSEATIWLQRCCQRLWTRCACLLRMLSPRLEPSPRTREAKTLGAKSPPRCSGKCKARSRSRRAPRRRMQLSASKRRTTCALWLVSGASVRTPRLTDLTVSSSALLLLAQRARMCSRKRLRATPTRCLILMPVPTTKCSSARQLARWALTTPLWTKHVPAYRSGCGFCGASSKTPCHGSLCLSTIRRTSLPSLRRWPSTSRRDLLAVG
jgi:hypothetical protein